PPPPPRDTGAKVAVDERERSLDGRLGPRRPAVGHQQPAGVLGQLEQGSRPERFPGRPHCGQPPLLADPSALSGASAVLLWLLPAARPPRGDSNSSTRRRHLHGDRVSPGGSPPASTRQHVG